MPSAARSRPIFSLRSGHPRELLRVGCYEHGTISSRLSSEPDIVGADLLPDSFEFGANGSSGTRVTFVEQAIRQYETLRRKIQMCLRRLPRMHVPLDPVCRCARGQIEIVRRL
jgi:hypothetical protein